MSEQDVDLEDVTLISSFDVDIEARDSRNPVSNGHEVVGDDDGDWDLFSLSANDFYCRDLIQSGICLCDCKS